MVYSDFKVFFFFFCSRYLFRFHFELSHCVKLAFLLFRQLAKSLKEKKTTTVSNFRETPEIMARCNFNCVNFIFVISPAANLRPVYRGNQQKVRIDGMNLLVKNYLGRKKLLGTAKYHRSIDKHENGIWSEKNNISFFWLLANNRSAPIVNLFSYLGRGGCNFLTCSR